GHAPDDFLERLDTFRLPGSYIAAKFTFTTRKYTPFRSANVPTRPPHYDLFPKVVGEIVSAFNISELRLSLTQGSWRNTLWGDTADFSSPAGAEGDFDPRILEIWVRPHTGFSPDGNWRTLIRALSGIFCGSFSQIESKFTIIPQLDNLPSSNVVSVESGNARYLNRTLGRYGVLPHESVCTENLTPWKKLLPCKAKRGLSQLLNPQRLFSSSYNSVQLKIKHFCVNDACKVMGLELMQTEAVVFYSEAFQKGFAFSKLFQSYIDKSCTLALTSVVTFSDTTGTHEQLSPIIVILFPQKFEVTPAIAKWTDHNRTAFFEVKELLASRSFIDFEIKFDRNIDKNFKFFENHITIHTYLTGNNQRQGSIVSLIDNKNDENVRVLYSHVIPWYVRIHFHTLKIFGCGALIKPESMFYRPAIDRYTPHYLEIVLMIKRETFYKLSIEFEKSLLRWTEYPPDAHHGFYIPAPSITFRFKNSAGKRIYGEVLLVTLPTPDFSMPYNVICLVCTFNQFSTNFEFIDSSPLMEKTLKISEDYRWAINFAAGR
uniref:Uncharacterized protein n=1 Tax=Romanomermis culicivorax TaxID=13658 RepID=A0A915IZC3_ROMCU